MLWWATPETLLSSHFLAFESACFWLPWWGVGLLWTAFTASIPALEVSVFHCSCLNSFSANSFAWAALRAWSNVLSSESSVLFVVWLVFATPPWQFTAKRVHNRFGGMQDLAIFLWRYSRCELKKGAGRGNFDNEREGDFLFILGWDAEIVRESSGKRELSFVVTTFWLFCVNRLCTSPHVNEACQIYPLSPLRVFVLFRYLVKTACANGQRRGLEWGQETN